METHSPVTLALIRDRDSSWVNKVIDLRLLTRHLGSVRPWRKSRNLVNFLGISKFVSYT